MVDRIEAWVRSSAQRRRFANWTGGLLVVFSLILMLVFPGLDRTYPTLSRILAAASVASLFGGLTLRFWSRT